MLLDSTAPAGRPSPPKGRFLYARVLGAYHVNVGYIGPGMLDYNPRRVDFLWVRWYKVVRKGNDPFSSSELPQLSFYPLHSPDAFGFVDPRDVLRSCHIIPKFASGQPEQPQRGLSRCGKARDDYKNYYVGWYVNIDSVCIVRFSPVADTLNWQFLRPRPYDALSLGNGCWPRSCPWFG